MGTTFDDVLDGKAGADQLLGGKGDDTYVVDSQDEDTIVELVDEGSDTVASSVTYTLNTANVENVALTGDAEINATGDAGANRLTGNSAANILDGAAGTDGMAGGGGDDTYVVEDTGDVVVELAGQGTDTVLSSLDYVLTANVENLVLGDAPATIGRWRHRMCSASG